jgi:hypothetical protein
MLSLIGHPGDSKTLTARLYSVGQRIARGLEHDPEKWAPVFRKRSCSNKKIERDDESKRSHQQEDRAR